MLTPPTADKIDAPRVLVVEDDGDLRMSLCEMLEEAGYGVLAATNGHEALDVLRSKPTPAVILLDLMMPVMDGWTFIAELKKDPVLALLPVVVTTGAGFRVLSSAPVSAGYLEKPISRDRLLQTIALGLRRKRSS